MKRSRPSNSRLTQCPMITSVISSNTSHLKTSISFSRVCLIRTSISESCSKSLKSVTRSSERGASVNQQSNSQVLLRSPRGQLSLHHHQMSVSKALRSLETLNRKICSPMSAKRVIWLRLEDQGNRICRQPRIHRK